MGILNLLTEMFSQHDQRKSGEVPGDKDNAENKHKERSHTKLSISKEELVREFHKLYYYNSKKTWENTYWLGVSTLKCPLDLWLYQEMIVDIRPDVIVETGTFRGGSALFLASICELVGNGKVFTIDIDGNQDKPKNERISYFTGSSTSRELVDKVKRQISPECSVLAILDSNHSKDHVLSEMRIYSDIVTEGSYLIVEDTNVNGNPVLPDYGEGPMEAVREFLKDTNDFVVDHDKEKFYLTFSPHGYLRKIS